MFRFKVEPVDVGQETSGRFQLAINERGIEDEFGLGVGELRLPPPLDLALQGLEIPLNALDPDRQCVQQVEALSVFCQHWGEIACDNVSKFP